MIEDQPTQEKPVVPMGEVIGVTAKMLFGFVAARKGGHWQLSNEEASEFGEASAAVIDKYYPDVKGGPELTLIAVTGAIAIPRLMTDKQIAMEEQKRKEAEENEQTEPQPAQ